MNKQIYYNSHNKYTILIGPRPKQIGEKIVIEEQIINGIKKVKEIKVKVFEGRPACDYWNNNETTIR